MKRLLKHFWFYYFIASFGVTFIFFFPLQFIFLKKKSWYGLGHRYRSFWARVILLVWGVRYSVENSEVLKKREQVIICSNHSSFLDILVLCAVFRKDISFMAKSELANIPLFGLYFRTIDIAVDRNDMNSGLNAYRKAVRNISQNKNLVIFPEGGIFPDPQKIKPFKDGAFQLALRYKIPILPVGLPDNYKILPDESRMAKPGKIRLILHRSIQTSDLKITDVGKIKDDLQIILQQDLIS